MKEKIIVEFDFLEDDFKRFWKFIAWDSPDKSTVRFKSLLPPIAGFIVGFGMFAFFIFKDSNSFLGMFFLGCICISIFVFTNDTRKGELIERKASEILLLPENKNILGRTIIEFNSENITSKTNIGETNYRWNAITKIIISDFDYYLHVTSESAIVIPQRVFNNESKLAFENLLKSKTEVIDFRK